VIFAAFYMLPMVQKVIFNALTKPANRSIPDLNARELTILVPLVVAIFWIGVYPQPFLERMQPSAERLLREVSARQFVSAPALKEASPGIAAAPAHGTN
jgi:NADH-quinone oxidoreductase subunit M